MTPRQSKFLCRLVLVKQNPRGNDTLLITLLLVSDSCTSGVFKTNKQVFGAVVGDFDFSNIR